MTVRARRRHPALRALVECVICGQYAGLNPHTVLTGLCGRCEDAQLVRTAPAQTAG